MDNHLRVAGRPEGVAAGLERVPELPEVVYLSVEHYREALILIEHRLVAALEVDDAEPAHTQGHRIIHKKAFVVRPAMTHPPHHLADNVRRQLRLGHTY